MLDIIVKMKNILLSIAAVLLTFSCMQGINPRDLYGEWKYVKVDNRNHNFSDSVTSLELAEQSPSITFSEQGDLIIMWGGKQLSAGKFRLEGNIIRYTENLPDGKVREFPFLIVDLSVNELVFQTMEREVTYITAKKVNNSR